MLKYEVVNDKTKELLLKLSKDICAMKMMAISDNGSRMKDYVDISSLSNKFSLNMMNEMFIKKYNFSSNTYFIKRLAFMLNTDIDYQNIVMINKKFKWEEYRDNLIKMIDKPNEIIKYNDENKE